VSDCRDSTTARQARTARPSGARPRSRRAFAAVGEELSYPGTAYRTPLSSSIFAAHFHVEVRRTEYASLVAGNTPQNRAMRRLSRAQVVNPSVDWRLFDDGQETLTAESWIGDQRRRARLSLSIRSRTRRSISSRIARTT
jgi:hypothetical protein